VPIKVPAMRLRRLSAKATGNGKPCRTCLASRLSI
jgi:hypothetical protein